MFLIFLNVIPIISISPIYFLAVIEAHSGQENYQNCYLSPAYDIVQMYGKNKKSTLLITNIPSNCI